MKFYPIVYTRTALRDPVKGRDGVDFVYRALAPGFVGSPLENLTRQAINEDRFPAMATPRRVFCRTEKYVFWGLALHNDFFLPSEVCEALELSEGERKLRGFWGGFVELHEGDVLSNETLRWIAATLESRDSDSALTNDVASLFKTQVEKESTFVGRSPFVFASRLFQRFVQKDWTNPKVPKRDGERNLNFAPIISEKPFDLRFFAPEPSETSEFAPLPVDALQLFASANFNDVDATNALWRRFVFASNARLHVVAPLTCENHADRCVSSDCALDGTALLDATGVRAYRPPQPEAPLETPEETPSGNPEEAKTPTEPKEEEKRPTAPRQGIAKAIIRFFRKCCEFIVRLFSSASQSKRRSERREPGDKVESFEQMAKRQIAEIDGSTRDKTSRTARVSDEESGSKKSRPATPKIDFYAGRGQNAPRSDANEDRGMF